jgi:UDP-N-acetylmuramate: L-alanyl-gamma-D-glutamyl-meso-diaminopimelate ligase
VRYPAARLWAIFEPRSNTLRRKVLQRELVSSLALADEVVITPIFKPEAVPENDRLTTASVVNGVRRAGKSARELADADVIVAEVAQELRSGDVVAILSNGGFGGIYEKLPRKLEELRGVSTSERANQARTAIPDSAKPAKSGSPGSGDPGTQRA